MWNIEEPIILNIISGVFFPVNKYAYESVKVTVVCHNFFRTMYTSSDGNTFIKTNTDDDQPK
jgi:hypothetical protein